MDVETLKIVVGLLNGVSEHVFWAVIVWIGLDFLQSLIYTLAAVGMFFYIVRSVIRAVSAVRFTQHVFAMFGRDPEFWHHTGRQDWVLNELREMMKKVEESENE